MNHYETIYILRADLPEENKKKLNEKIAEVLNRQGGKLLAQKDLGAKSLSYRIKKQTRGHYFQLDYACAGTAIGELERSLKLTEEVIRFLTVRAELRAEGGPSV